MTEQVPDQNPRNQYTATGGQTVFPYTFLAITNTDLAVERNGVLLALTVDYTVSGIGNPSGGNVTLNVGVTVGDIITIYRNMVFDRQTDYQDSGDFLANTVDEDFNRIWLALQQLRASQGNVLQVSQSDDLIGVILPMDIPSKSARRLNLLGFDGSGNPVAVAPLSAGTSDSNFVNYTDLTSNQISVQEGLSFVEDVVRNYTFQAGSDSGVADAYVWTPSAPLGNTSVPALFLMLVSNDNTGPSTVEIKDYNGVTLAIQNIYADGANTPLAAGTLRSGVIYGLLSFFGNCYLVFSGKAVSQTIADDAVETVNIKDNAVTGAKILIGSVSGDRLIDDTVDGEKLIDNSVPVLKMNNGGAGDYDTGNSLDVVYISGQTPGTTFIKADEAKCNVSGSYKVKTNVINVNRPVTVRAIVYKNGVAVGTDISATSGNTDTNTDTLAFVAGDFIQLYVRQNLANNTGQWIAEITMACATPLTNFSKDII